MCLTAPEWQNIEQDFLGGWVLTVPVVFLVLETETSESYFLVCVLNSIATTVSMLAEPQLRWTKLVPLTTLVSEFTCIFTNVKICDQIVCPGLFVVTHRTRNACVLLLWCFRHYCWFAPSLCFPGCVSFLNIPRSIKQNRDAVNLMT